MDIWKEFVAWCKREFKPEQPVVCAEDPVHVHDWETVKRYDMDEVANALGLEHRISEDGQSEWLEAKDGSIIVRPSHFNSVRSYAHIWARTFPSVRDAVCLVCGECRSGLDLYKEVLEKRKAIQVRAMGRSILAKRMWEEGCHGKTSKGDD